MGWLLLVAVLLGGLGLWLLLRSGMMRRMSGLPVGRVTYVDTGAWDRNERPLFSNEFRLTGKPDYLVETRRGVVPVEVKSGIAPERPYESHVLQLAAYCLLVEEQEGRAPPHGILKYADRAFEMDYTPRLRRELLAVLDAIRRDLRAQNVAHGVGRSHDDPARCQGCGYRDRCEERI